MPGYGGPTLPFGPPPLPPGYESAYAATHKGQTAYEGPFQRPQQIVAQVQQEATNVVNALNPFGFVGTLIADLQKAALFIALGGIAVGAAYLSLTARDATDEGNDTP